MIYHCCCLHSLNYVSCCYSHIGSMQILVLTLSHSGCCVSSWARGRPCLYILTHPCADSLCWPMHTIFLIHSTYHWWSCIKYKCISLTSGLLEGNSWFKWKILPLYAVFQWSNIHWSVAESASSVSPFSFPFHRQGRPCYSNQHGSTSPGFYISNHIIQTANR